MGRSFCLRQWDTGEDERTVPKTGDTLDFACSNDIIRHIFRFKEIRHWIHCLPYRSFH